MDDTSTSRKSTQRHAPWTLLAVLAPGGLFATGLWMLRDHPQYAWVTDISTYPWEFWIIAACGLPATGAGIADWRFHRSGQAFIGTKEHDSEWLALVGGGLPLFGLMAGASLAAAQWLLVPILVVALFTVVLICYDEFVFHRKRCGFYETCLHRMLVLGNGVAWLAWMNWCFVRGGIHG